MRAEAGHPSPAALARECRTFTRALIGELPGEPVIAAYRRAHEADAPLAVPGSRIDRWLARLGAVHPALARMADAYAALFVRRGAFRAKLVALLAILESGAPHHRRFEAPGRGRAAAWSLLVVWGLGATLALLAGLLVFGPLHLVSKVVP